MLSFFAMRYREVKGHWPLFKAKKDPAGSDVQKHSSEEIMVAPRDDSKTTATEETSKI